MDIARWEQVQALFHDALERPESQRQAFLETACGGDEEMRAEVVIMLQADERSTSLLDRSLADVAYQMVGAPLESVSSHEFGPYRLLRVLGEGGMGVVWLAERADTGNQVAIKFLPHAGLSPARRERFAREIKTLAKLRHPLIARLYDAGALADGTPWFVMEYVEGERFIDYCRREVRPVEERLRLFRSVCEAVQYAHGQEIIHRDLKPSNILVEQDGTPRLLDFGIARELHNLESPAEATRPALRFVSPDYAAPEWLDDGTVGFYTDVYALGVILYEMLAGELPFKRSGSPAQDAAPHPTQGEPARPSITAKRLGERQSTVTGVLPPGKTAWGDLDVLCLKALHRDARKRYPSVEALIRDIDHFLDREPLEARPDTLRYRLGKFVSRNRTAVMATAAAFCLVVGLVIFFTVGLARERDRANREAAITAAMNRFLSDDLLGKSDPFRSSTAAESFVDVVNQASPQIDSQFKGEPVVAARLHQTIARAFDNRSDFPHARQQYKQASSLFRQGEGPLSQDAILTDLRRAAMEARVGQPGSTAISKSVLADAQTSISKTAHPRGDLEVFVLAAGGDIAIAENDARSANRCFAAALKRAQSMPTLFDEDQQRIIKSLLAFSFIRLGDGASAEPLFREMAEEYARIGGPGSPAALRQQVLLSQALLTQRKYAQALREEDSIYPALVERLGADHETTLVLLGTRAATEGHLGMWDAAARDDLTFYDQAVRKLGPASIQALGALSDAGLSECSAGHYRQGEANASKAFQRSKQSFGPRAAITGGASFSLATCLVGLNRLPEAWDLLEAIDVPAVAQLAGDPTVGADVALTRGEIAARRGDYTAAQRYATVAAVAFDRPDADATTRQQLQSLRKDIQLHFQASR